VTPSRGHDAGSCTLRVLAAAHCLRVLRQIYGADPAVMIEIRADARRAKERPVTRCDGTRRYCAAAGKWNGVFISGVTQRVAEMPPAQSLIGGTEPSFNSAVEFRGCASHVPWEPERVPSSEMERRRAARLGRHTIHSHGGESPAESLKRDTCVSEANVRSRREAS